MRHLHTGAAGASPAYLRAVPRAAGPFAPDDDWLRYQRLVSAAAPPWAFDREFVAELAAEHLPRIFAHLGLGELLGRIAPYAKQVAGPAAPLFCLPLDPDGRWMLLRLDPGSSTLIAVDSLSHAWRCPVLAQRGDDLVDLGCWRWSTTPAKAAFRIARACGRKRPMPWL